MRNSSIGWFGLSGGVHQGDPPALLELDPARVIPCWQSPRTLEGEGSIYGEDNGRIEH
ncbi:MAG: hypothetical protein AAGF11_09870 [Myxococcota bacterium]